MVITKENFGFNLRTDRINNQNEHMFNSFIRFSDDLKRITPDSDETHINQGKLFS